jgi:hypothetical protein
MNLALRLAVVSLTLGLLSLALSGPGQAGSLHYSYGTHGGHGSHYGSHQGSHYSRHGAHGLLGFLFGHHQRRHSAYNYGHHDKYRYGSNYGAHTYSHGATYNSHGNAHASHGSNYKAQGNGCHAVYKIGYWDGYKAKIGGTMCYDSYGKSYVIPGSRYVIEYY